MQLLNPIPAVATLLVLAWFAGLLSRRFPLLDVQATHGQTTPIDGLRGILAASVFLHHVVIFHQFLIQSVWKASPSRFYEQLGTGAVTMFFFVSGFLFWRKAVRSPASVSWRVLVPNRIRRIVPAFYLAVAVLLVLVAGLSHLHRLEGRRGLAGSILEWLCFGIPFAFPSINNIDPMPISAGVYWTLRLEWLFYLSLPAFALFRSVRRIWVLFCVAYALNFWLSRVHVRLPWDDSLRILGQYCAAVYSAFSIGMLTVYIERIQHVKNILQKRFVAAICRLVAIFGIAYVHPVFGVPESLIFAPSFLAIACGNDFFRVLTSAASRSLGAISYSMYVLHGLILYTCLRVIGHFVALKALPAFAYWLMACAVGLVVVLISAASFRYVEKPFFARRAVS